jgi:hypothetical protein
MVVAADRNEDGKRNTSRHGEDHGLTLLWRQEEWRPSGLTGSTLASETGSLSRRCAGRTV